MKKVLCSAIVGSFILAVSAQAGVLGSVTQELEVGGTDSANIESVTGLSSYNMQATGVMRASGITHHGIAETYNSQFFATDYGATVVATDSESFALANHYCSNSAAYGENITLTVTPSALIKTNEVTQAVVNGTGVASSNAHAEVILFGNK